jgi:hypothetical protein
MDHIENTALLLSCSCPLPRERVCRAVAQKRLRHGPHRKHRSSIVVFVSVATGACLPSCCPETVVARATKNTALLLLRALPSNDRCLKAHRLATGLRHSILENIAMARKEAVLGILTDLGVFRRADYKEAVSRLSSICKYVRTCVYVCVNGRRICRWPLIMNIRDEKRGFLKWSPKLQNTDFGRKEL